MSQGPAPGTVVEFESRCPVCERHTGRIEMCGCEPVRLSARLRFGEWAQAAATSGVWCNAVFSPEVVALCCCWLDARQGAGEWSTGSLDRNLNVKPGAIRDGDAEDDSQAAFVRSLHLFLAEEKTFGWHRASVVIWHQPRQKGRRTRAVAGDWRRRSWDMRLSA